MMKEEIEARVFKSKHFDDALIEMYHRWAAGKRFNLEGFDDKLMRAYWRFKDKELSKAAVARLINIPASTCSKKLTDIDAMLYLFGLTLHFVRSRPKSTPLSQMHQRMTLSQPQLKR